jgi:hypothetical protein
MTDETELPVLTNLTEALAPTHEPAPVPADTTLTLPSGEAVPLHIVRENATYPVAEPVAFGGSPADDAEDDEGGTWVTPLEADQANALVQGIFEGIEALHVHLDELAAEVRTHGIALNEILHALRPKPVERSLRDMVKGWPEPKDKAKPKAKVKAKPKAKAKAPAKRARR